MQVAGAEMLVAETIRRLGRRIEPVVICLDGVGLLGKRMHEEGVPVIELGRRPGLDLRVARRLSRVIVEHDLEVVHAHQYTPFFYSALARLSLRRRPVHVIFTEHGRHYPDVVSPRRRLLNRVLLSRLADDITAVCEFSARSLADVDGFANRSIAVIDNGVDVPRSTALDDPASLRARLGLDPRRRYVASIARFHPVKDHATLLRAFSLVVQTREDVDLLLAGDGPLKNDLMTLAEALGIKARVQFLGIRHDVPELLRAVDIFALTSLSEAASLTLLEAMAAAVPVVVTRVGGNPELVVDGEEGYLVPREDDAEVARAILTLLEDPARARAFGAAGQRRVQERFQLNTSISRYADLYQAAAARLRGVPASRAVA
jgi:N-acetyl-alpha-D-glucosaminyl L-malate synthase BshA